MVKGAGWLVSALIAVLIAGCAAPHSVPVQDRSRTKVVRQAPSVSSSSVYVVRKGDTLYSIAFRHGLSYRTVARLNNISGDYQIYPGQRLVLKPSAQKIVRDSSAHSKSTSANSSTVSKSAKKPVKKPTSPPKTVEKRTNSTASANTSKKTASAAGRIRWQWPSKGRLIASFKTKGQVNKGVNLAGRKGDPVFAAASGTVVYAGNGLLGYGNLIIIDHNQNFLSAYAHNSRVLVKESDKVTVGDKIAEMGRSGAERVMLHFEIRRDGVPVNPLRYLPKKQ
ncbi:peptidoglycan DD-metalloendopeptidase family protein [Pontibacterium sp.]|uniref:peptidoglycan DD-metalloendopeptidase family protein n=1 Tax=Pontibacterium sp. TaxID=2036026 RepID=UPI0035196595